MYPLRSADMPDGSWTVDIDAPPDAVWRVVSDPSRTPEWSPVCHTIEVLDAERFVGHNRLNGVRWSRECRITERTPGAAFAWSTYFKGRESTRWRYELEPLDDGARTHLTETYEIVSVPKWIRTLWLLPGARQRSRRDVEANLGASLERLKQAAEREARAAAG